MRDLEELMYLGKSTLDFADGVAPDLSSPQVSHLERVVLLTGTMVETVANHGLTAWLVQQCQRNRRENLHHRMAVIALKHWRSDPEIAYFLFHAMEQVDSMVQLLNEADGNPNAIPASRFNKAKARYSWCDAVFDVYSNRIANFLNAACLAWNENLDPLATPDLPESRRRTIEVRASKGPVRYPSITVGLTQVGITCRVRAPELDEGEDASPYSILGATCLALWVDGVGLEEIRRFHKEFTEDPDLDRLGRWVNVDGDGMAGAERLKHTLARPHPWQSILGMTLEEAIRTRILFCAHRQQAEGLLLLQRPARLVVIGQRVKGAKSSTTHAIRSPEDMASTLTNVIQRGCRDIILEVDDAGCDEALSSVLIQAAGQLNCLAIVGASPRFRSMLEAQYEKQMLSDPFSAVSVVVIGKAPTFGGPVLH